jgi:hypothetical protein
VKRCKWLHGQYRHEGTGEAQGDGTEVVNVFWKQYHNMLSALGPALYDATVELIADWWNEMRTWQTVKILKRNVDTQSKNMIRYGKRRADVEAKYKTKPTGVEISKWREELQLSATAQSAKPAAASKSTTTEVFLMLTNAEDLFTSLSEFKQYPDLLPTKASEQTASQDEDAQEVLDRIFAGLSVAAKRAIKLNSMDRIGLDKRISTVHGDSRRTCRPAGPSSVPSVCADGGAGQAGLAVTEHQPQPLAHPPEATPRWAWS